jgi:L-fucose isomerase-like protein
MEKLKIGFVPAHRVPFDENWGEEMRKRCVEAFAKIKEIEVIVPSAKLTAKGLVRNDSDAEKTISLFKEAGIDGLIIGTMTFGEEIPALAVASAFRDLPIFLFGTKEGPFTADGGRRSDSFCGTLSISSGLHRREIPFSFGGMVFPEEKPFIAKVNDFVRVCSIIKGFIGAKIGLVGPRPEAFETCIFSEDAMMMQFDQRVVPTSLADITYRMSKIKASSAEMTQLNKEIKKQADTSALKPEVLSKIESLELALQQFAKEKGLSGLGIQCWTAIQEVYGLSPCYAMGRLTDSGVMTACEVDIYGTLTMLIQYLAALKTTVPHFIDWTIQNQEKANTFLAWHCGNAPPSLACDNCKLPIKYHSVLGEQLGKERSMGTAEFQLKPGVVTICRLIEHDGVFKMLITTGKIVNTSQKLRGSWSWVQVPDLEELYQVLVEEGFTHHASLIHGDYVNVIEDACAFMGIDTVIV